MRYRAEAKTYEKATVSALWAVWKEAGGRMEPDPDSTLAEEPEPEDDNVIFQEGGESFTGTEAVMLPSMWHYFYVITASADSSHFSIPKSRKNTGAGR